MSGVKLAHPRCNLKRFAYLQTSFKFKNNVNSVCMFTKREQTSFVLTLSLLSLVFFKGNTVLLSQTFRLPLYKSKIIANNFDLSIFRVRFKMTFLWLVVTILLDVNILAIGPHTVVSQYRSLEQQHKHLVYFTGKQVALKTHVTNFDIIYKL